MNARPMFPTDPGEVAHVVDLLMGEAEALNGERRQSEGAWHHLRAWLAIELRRDPRGEPLPVDDYDVAFSTPGYFEDCARLFVRLGSLIRFGPTWEGADDRAKYEAEILAQIQGIALASMQYVNGEPVERVIARDGARQAGPRKPRGSKMPNLDLWLDGALAADPNASDKDLWRRLERTKNGLVHVDGEYIHDGRHKVGDEGFSKRVTAARKRRNAVNT